jgi:hypothetical protein
MTGSVLLSAAMLLVLGARAAEPQAPKPFQRQLKVASIDPGTKTISVREPDLEVTWNEATRFLHHRSIRLGELKRGVGLHVLGKLHLVRTTTTQMTDSALTDVAFLGTGEAYEHPPLTPQTAFSRWHYGTLSTVGTTHFLRIGEAAHRLALPENAAAYSLEKIKPEALSGKSIIVRGEPTPAGGDAKRRRVTRVVATEVHLVELNAEHANVFRLQWGETRKSPLGLLGEYFDNQNFTNLKVTRVDPGVNFEWGSGSPHPLIEADSFSVRWTGKITPPSTGTFTFQAVTDDGVRLWVDNQLLIDEFQRPADATGTIALVKGKKYDIRMEYFEGLKAAFAKLYWSGPSQPREIVSHAHLEPPPAGAPANARAP